MKEESGWKSEGVVEVERRGGMGIERRQEEREGRGGIRFQFTQCYNTIPLG